MEVPVYLFTGFLESGKTSFIQETLEDENFNKGEKMLLLAFEQGENEYDENSFSGKNVTVVYIEEKEDMNPDNLERLRKQCSAERVLIEYNGMWMLDELYKNLPEGWIVYQEMLFVDAGSFLSYNANMRSLVVDKLGSCEICIFNRFENSYSKLDFHKIVRATSRKTDIAYEYKDGSVEYDDIEDPLPFDKNAPVIEIADEDYALWYRDFAENVNDYIGKTVKIHVVTARNKMINAKNEVIIGRQIMTCCEADITFKGLLCKLEGAMNYQAGEWIVLTAQISMQKHRVYKSEMGPVLTTIEVQKSSAPQNPVATFF